jgi:hypothetical protein
VRNGTSFKTFHDRAGRPFLPDISVAGKTGTLASKNPESLITWWVGFAPADKPEVALSTVVINRGPWRIKGTHVAADMLRIYFADQGWDNVRYPADYRGNKRREENLEKRAASKAAADGVPTVDATAAPSAAPRPAPSGPPSGEATDQFTPKRDDEEND